MNKLISVIVPCYKSKQTIDRTIKSILFQEKINLEIILIVDFCPDKTYEYLNKKYSKHSNIFIYENDKNYGVAYTRNRGVDLCNGDLITFLDDDDIYLNKYKLNDEYKILKGYGFQKNYISYSNIYFIDLNNLILGKNFTKKPLSGNIFNQIIERKFVPRDFLMTKIYFLETGGYKTNLFLWEDWEWKIRLAVNGIFYFSNNKGIGYTISTLSEKKIFSLSGQQKGKLARLTKLEIYNKYIKDDIKAIKFKLINNARKNIIVRLIMRPNLNFKRFIISPIYSIYLKYINLFKN